MQPTGALFIPFSGGSEKGFDLEVKRVNPNGRWLISAYRNASLNPRGSVLMASPASRIRTVSLVVHPFYCRPRSAV